MNREMRKELGLANEAIEKIMAGHGREVEKAKAGAEQAATELEAANKKIAELSGAVKKFDGVDVEGLRARLIRLQKQYTPTPPGCASATRWKRRCWGPACATPRPPGHCSTRRH